MERMVTAVRTVSVCHAMDIKDDTRKRALLLYAAGNEVEKNFATLSEVGEDKEYKKAVEKLSIFYLRKMC